MIAITRRSALALSVAVFAGGCTSGAAVRNPDLVLPDNLSTSLSGSTPQEGLEWWRSLRDPEITAMVELALARSSDALQAAAQIEAARAQRAQSLAAFGLTGALEGNAQARRTRIHEGESNAQAGPTAGTSDSAAGLPQSSQGTGAGLGSGTVAGSERSATLTAGFGWEIDLFRRSAAVREAGDASVAAAIANSSAARLAVAAAVVDAVYEVRLLGSQLADAQYFDRLQVELERYVRAREAVGVGGRADVERAAVRTAQLRANVIRLRGEEQAAVRRLLTLIRSNDESLVRKGEALQLSLPPPPRELPADLLLRRPDVQAAYQRYLAQAARLRSADKELLPRVILRPGVSFMTTRAPIRLDSVTSFVGLQMTAPLFDRTRLIAVVREEGANAELAVIELERSVDRAFSEADQALTLYQTDLQRLPALEQAQQRAEQLRGSAAKLFESSLIDAKTLLDAERDWREARAAWLEARFTAARRHVDTFRAVGGGWGSYGQ